ncbi:MAG: DUF5329 domain-containing protein [Gammaproteobacteria bacterium]|nr:DUF5329 domain-containing protein [Gammaproteobacteria bacterium]NNJ50689.1 DUF5329 family protein [Gammaproteobacteria bacterium]
MKDLIKLKTLFLAILLINNIAVADVPANQVIEVSHLLAFVKESGCIINRNGTDHPAVKGISHIEKKYDYFRDDIQSTEEFIEYSATKSTMSGDYYMVSCPGKETIRTQDWLMAELKRFRTEQK